jgi:hypothetical protein
MLAELDRYRDPTADDVLPSVFLKRVMNDENAPLPARIMCAARVIPFIERRPAPAIQDEIPLMRHWTDEQYRDYRRRLKEDMLQAPWYYGREFFGFMDMPWPPHRPQEKLTKATPPSGLWYAQFEKDYRGGSGKPWKPGERERLLQTPFTPEELAWGRANGEDPDVA